MRFDESLIETVQQGLCNILGTAEFTAQLGGRFYGSIGLRGAQQTSQQAAQLWGNAAALACNRPPQPIDDFVFQPFEGGQCPGAPYRVDAQALLNGNPLGGPQTGVGPGPLSYDDTPRPDGGPAIKIVDANGDDLVSAGAPPGNTLEFTNVVVTRLDGNPDDCGNPPASGPEFDPGNFSLPTTVPFDDADGNPQNLPVTIDYRPVRNTDGGDFVVPISVTFDDGSSLFGDFNFSTGDINFGAGNTAGEGQQDQPVELPEEEEVLPEGTVIVGVRVTAGVNPSASRATQIFQGGGALDLYVPRLGTVRFQYRTPDGGLSWGPDLSVKGTDETFWSGPEAFAVQAFPNIGVTFATRLIVVNENAIGPFGGGGST